MTGESLPSGTHRRPRYMCLLIANKLVQNHNVVDVITAPKKLIPLRSGAFRTAFNPSWFLVYFLLKEDAGGRSLFIISLLAMTQ